MKISLFQGIILAIFGAGALIGITVFATFSGSSSSENTVGSVVIWGTLPKEQIQPVIDAGAQASDDYKGISYVEKSLSNFQNELASAIATGSGPDLVLVSQEMLVNIKKLIRPIPNETLSAATFTNTFADGAEIFLVPNNGGAFGVPVLIDPLLMYENRTILSSSGIAVAPSTWEGLTGLVPRVTQITPSQGISRSLIALGTYDNVQNARGILSALFLQTGVPLSYRNSAGSFSADLGQDTSNGVAPGSAVVRFYTQFGDSTKVSYTWNNALSNSRDAFLAGDLALYLGYASEASFISGANPNLYYDARPLPQPSTASVKSTYGLFYALMMPLGTKNPGGAYNAAALLTGTPDKALAQSTGLAPATRSLLANAPGDPLSAVTYQSAIYARGWLSPAPVDTDRVFSVMINNVTSGRLTLEAALSAAQSAMGELLH